MIKTFLFLLTVMTVRSGLWAQPPTPLQLYGDLFKSVQMQSVFQDGKTFVDCTPKIAPDKIVEKYNEQKGNPDFDLKVFVLNYFNLPETPESDFHTDSTIGIIQHINNLWSVLRREPDEPQKYSTLLPLPYPYIVPGGRFREIYYWDSYFTLLGLQTAGKTDMVENMVRNFAYLIHTYGFIPNGNRSYYLSRSQPPFFSLMIDLLAKEKGNSVYALYQPALLEEYKFWMQGVDSLQLQKTYRNVVKMPDGSTLNRYWDAGNYPREESWKADVEAAKKSKQSPEDFYRNSRATAESGMDFSSRWFADGKNISTVQTTNLVAVDLNSLLYHLEKTIAKSYQVTQNSKMEKKFLNMAGKRKKAVLKYCWNDQQEFFCDYLIKESKLSNDLTLAGMFPLFLNLATQTQAEKVRQVIQEKFLRPGGVVTTLKNTGEQWDAPNGWAPLEYVTIVGLNNYGFKDLAKEIAMRWINLNIKVFKNTGKLMEKYNVEDIGLMGGGGEYSLQDGFGWTNGVLQKLMKNYVADDTR